MKETSRDILVFPRECIRGYAGFIPWTDAQPLVRHMNALLAWLPRSQAETSRDFVQPIPCALIRSNTQRYCVLKRVRQTRADLRDRISLVVGGHVDKPDVPGSVFSLLQVTLLRELQEELRVTRVARTEPVGLVIDSFSITASRHVAFVYEVTVESRLTAQATEEFSIRSKFTGQFFTPIELDRFRAKFDPWSLVLFENYIAPASSLKLTRQAKLPLISNE